MKNAFSMLRPLVLASASPRRRDFLESAGVLFTCMPATCPEPRPLPGEEPRLYAMRSAEAKARFVLDALSARRDGPAVLAADTIVILRGEGAASILGKPRDEEEALAMLTRLSGRTHEVATACCLAVDGRTVCFDDVTKVTFAPWPRPVLEAYVAGGDPMDKAGAYGIQGEGAFLVRGIEGSWSTVAGLPLDLVLEKLIQNDVLALKKR
ncbi:Maf family protein [Mailhella massiliensis]|uniref:Maf family protein n=1 Tax=Mailhella massiliensis TaxID=1903261 RepID=UPI00097CEB62|nr:Maf family protein [Mailhella massiliensis]